MAPILIAGTAGAGKSTIARELASRGYRALDTDTDDELARWLDEDGVRVPWEDCHYADPQWTARHRWSWDPARVDAILAAPGAPEFWCGMSENVEAFASRFCAIVLLRVSHETMWRRILDPERRNEWGKQPEMRDYITRARRDHHARLAALTAVEIDGERPVDEVVQAVLSLR